MCRTQFRTFSVISGIGIAGIAGDHQVGIAEMFVVAQLLAFGLAGELLLGLAGELHHVEALPQIVKIGEKRSRLKQSHAF